MRTAHEEQLRRLPNVIGTGLGVKLRGGRRVANTALVVFVRQKLAERDLAPADQVPDFVEQAGVRVPTDLIAVAGIREEFGTAPYFISDRVKKGTVTAFARSESSWHAVSCAHCLRGRDGNPHTTEPVDFWDTRSGQYVPAGENVFSVSSPGYGQPGNFGFSDAGLVRLIHPALMERAKRAPPLPIARSVRKGMAVKGEAPRSTILGEICAIEVAIDRRRADVVVFMPGQGTVPGNSGMLWRARDGTAVAVHAMGMYSDESAESRYSLAMLASRLAQELQVDLLDPEG